MRKGRGAIVLLVLLAGFVGPAAAQSADDGLEAYRAKGSLSDEEQAALRAWVNERIVSVVGPDASAAQQAFVQLRDGFRGSDAFRQAYVAACVDTIGSAVKKADLVAAARLITLFSRFDDIRTLDMLLGALADERAAVRAAAAVALRKLRPKLAANPDAFRQALAALQTAAKKETSAKTLELIYLALDYAGVAAPPDRKQAAAAVLDVLKARAAQAAAGKLPAEGAEARGLAVAWDLRADLDAAARQEYARVVGQFLHYGVRRYASGEHPLSQVRDKTSSPELVRLRNSIELLIDRAEKQLTELLRPEQPPQVTRRMLKAEYVEMVIELNAWAKLLNQKLGLQLPDVQQPPKPGGEQPAEP